MSNITPIARAYNGPREADGTPIRCNTCNRLLRDLPGVGYGCDCLWGHAPTADEVCDMVESIERGETDICPNCAARNSRSWVRCRACGHTRPGGMADFLAKGGGLV